MLFLKIIRHSPLFNWLAVPFCVLKGVMYMSWIHDEYDKHSKKAKPIMDRANSIINDFNDKRGMSNKP